MYPYHLGCHLKTGQLCRIPHPDLGCGIPQGFARVIRYKLKYGSRIWRNPYDINDGTTKRELLSYYWSIKRWTDIQYELGEPRTGPNMAMIFTSFCEGTIDLSHLKSDMRNLLERKEDE